MVALAMADRVIADPPAPSSVRYRLARLSAGAITTGTVVTGATRIVTDVTGEIAETMIGEIAGIGITTGGSAMIEMIVGIATTKTASR
jgi:hypothetical protein